MCFCEGQWLFVRDRTRTSRGYSSDTIKLRSIFEIKREKTEKSVHAGTRTWFTGLILHRFYQLATGAAAKQNPLVLRI